MTRGSPGRRERRVSHAHKMVAQTAQEMAKVVWDQIMTTRGDLFDIQKRAHPDMTTAELEEHFCSRLWPTMLDEARGALAGMLRSPSIDPLQAKLIYDALRLDNTLLRGRNRMTQQVIGAIGTGEKLH